MKTPVIRFLTAGSVDDGKSTLIGRLLYDTNSLPTDQIEEVKHATDKSFENGDMDFSLYLDGLSSERDQKITIDVAYRYFSYESQKFIIVDAPGHEQYTKNMAVAAGNSEAIIVLVDATKGLQPQTIRHSLIAQLFGIKRVIVAINKMDLASFSQKTFEEIKEDYIKQTKNMDFEDISFVPIVAVHGDNVLNKSKSMPWYSDKTIIAHLQSFQGKSYNSGATSLQVQQVSKHNKARYYQGILSSGTIKVGDSLTAYPTNQQVTVEEIVVSGRKSDSADTNSSLSLTLNKEIDLDRGGLLRSSESKPLISNKFHSKIVYFSENALDINKSSSLLIKINHQYFRASIESINQVFDGFKTHENSDKNIQEIKMNQIVDINIKVSETVYVDKFSFNTNLGAFLLIDKDTNETLAGGIILDALESSSQANIDDSKDLFLQDLSKLIDKHFGQDAKKYFA